MPTTELISSHTAKLADTVSYRRFAWDSPPIIPVGVSVIIVTWAGDATLNIFVEGGEATLEQIGTSGRTFRCACRAQSGLAIQATYISQADLSRVLGTQIITT